MTLLKGTHRSSSKGNIFIFKTGSPQCNMILCEEGILYPSVMEKLIVLPAPQMPVHGKQQTKQHDEGIFPSQTNQVWLQYKVKVQLGKGKVSNGWLPPPSLPTFPAPCLQELTLPFVRKNPTFLITVAVTVSYSMLDWPGAAAWEYFIINLYFHLSLVKLGMINVSVRGEKFSQCLKMWLSTV